MTIERKTNKDQVGNNTIKTKGMKEKCRNQQSRIE